MGGIIFGEKNDEYVTRDYTTGGDLATRIRYVNTMPCAKSKSSPRQKRGPYKKQAAEISN